MEWNVCRNEQTNPCDKIKIIGFRFAADSTIQQVTLGPMNGQALTCSVEVTCELVASVARAFVNVLRLNDDNICLLNKETVATVSLCNLSLSAPFALTKSLLALYLSRACSQRKHVDPSLAGKSGPRSTGVTSCSSSNAHDIMIELATSVRVQAKVASVKQ